MKANKSTPSPRSERMITFEILTTKPLPVGQQVFISGSLDMFGAWQPDGFPLTRLDDNAWTGYTVISEGLSAEFKITRGTWGSEEADENGVAIPKNYNLAASGTVSFKHKVARWVDRA